MANSRSAPGRGFTSGNIAAPRIHAASRCTLLANKTRQPPRQVATSATLLIMSFRKLFTAILLAPALLGFNSFCLGAAGADTNIFGFTGPEIFPIDAQVESLHVEDI